MEGLVGNCVFLEDSVYGWFGGELCILRGPSVWMVWWGTVYSWRTQCMDGLVRNCVFLEDPVYGWFGGELCIPGGPSVWMVW